LRFYLDADLSPSIAALLRRRGIDATSAHDAGNGQLSDREQLAFAARERRCLVTRNARHFCLLGQARVRRHEPHAGIVLCPPSLDGSELGAIAARIVRVAERFSGGLGEYDVIYL
jgi:predicted nuclease of predicted toxin-antitoxin system